MFFTIIFDFEFRFYFSVLVLILSYKKIYFFK